VDDFHKFLRSLGFITFKSGRVSYSNEEFCTHLQSAVDRSSLNVDWQKIKLDLVRAVPIFIKDGVEFRWSHKALQEYFTAQYVAFDLASKREEAVKRIFESDEVVRFREVLRFIAEADIALVRDVCIEPILADIYESEMSDEEFSLSVIFESVDIFYVGNFEGGIVNAQTRTSLQDSVKNRLGIDASGRLYTSYVRHSDSYAVLICLKDNGIRYVLLPMLDAENFQTSKRSDDMPLYRHWYKKFGKSTVHINPDVATQKSAIDITGGLKALASAAQIPLLTRAIHERVVADNAKRRKALESSVLEGF
jgi:hypothetical protein